MAEVPILNLPVAISIDGHEWFPLVQGGITKRTTIGLVQGTGIVVGIDTLEVIAAGAVAVPITIGRVRINMPDPGGIVVLQPTTLALRGMAPLEIYDVGGNAIIFFTPGGADTVMGISGSQQIGQSNGKGFGLAAAMTLRGDADHPSEWYSAP